MPASMSRWSSTSGSILGLRDVICLALLSSSPAATSSEALASQALARLENRSSSSLKRTRPILGIRLNAIQYLSSLLSMSSYNSSTGVLGRPLTIHLPALGFQRSWKTDGSDCRSGATLRWWRRGWDSNPWNCCQFTRFPSAPIRPL